MTSQLTKPELNAMSETQAANLLGEHSFGRLAYNESGNRPTIVPINYVFDGESAIVIRTAPGSKLNCAPLSWLALEIDEVDVLGQWGWSVVACGYAFNITTALDTQSFSLRRMASEPVVAGERDTYLSIHVRTISGRSFGDAPI